MLLFQHKGVADQAFLTGGAMMEPMEPTDSAAQDYARMFQQLARPESDTQEAAVTAGINWYRCVEHMLLAGCLFSVCQVLMDTNTLMDTVWQSKDDATRLSSVRTAARCLPKYDCIAEKAASAGPISSQRPSQQMPSWTCPMSPATP